MGAPLGAGSLQLAPAARSGRPREARTRRRGAKTAMLIIVISAPDLGRQLKRNLLPRRADVRAQTNCDSIGRAARRQQSQAPSLAQRLIVGRLLGRRADGN